jgi:hypothetical protein
MTTEGRGDKKLGLGLPRTGRARRFDHVPGQVEAVELGWPLGRIFLIMVVEWQNAGLLETKTICFGIR